MQVTPINPKAAGSYRERKEALAILARAKQLVKSNDVEEVAAVYDDMEQMIRKHATPDEGRTLDDEFAILSEEEFQTMLGRVLGGSNDTIPPSSTSS